MTNYINSVIAATRRRFARSMHNPSSAVLLLVIMTVASGGPASAAADETEAGTFFTKFVAAQNAHNADDVKAMLWNSRSALVFARCRNQRTRCGRRSLQGILRRHLASRTRHVSISR